MLVVSYLACTDCGVYPQVLAALGWDKQGLAEEAANPLLLDPVCTVPY